MKEVLRECLSLLKSGIDRFPWVKRRAYADWLAQTAHCVTHSTHLLETAAARVPRDGRGDALHRRFAAHMVEEKRHELLAIHDINSLGCSLAQLPERPAIRAFCAPQYYKLEHQDPVAVFGYTLMLEGLFLAQGRWALGQVESAHGGRCTAFLKVHAADDVDHLERTFRALEGLDGRGKRQIEENLGQTAFGYAVLLAEIEQTSGAGPTEYEAAGAMAP